MAMMVKEHERNCQYAPSKGNTHTCETRLLRSCLSVSSEDRKKGLISHSSTRAPICNRARVVGCTRTRRDSFFIVDGTVNFLSTCAGGWRPRLLQHVRTAKAGRAGGGGGGRGGTAPFASEPSPTSAWQNRETLNATQLSGSLN